MIVLAGAIILSLNNAGIIERANEAVKKTDEATVKEIAQMAWAEAYAEGVRTVEGENGFQAKVDAALIANNVDTNEYVVTATLQGVNISLASQEPWVQNGLTLTRGEDKLTIGQDINYKSGVSGYTDEKGWKVLGVDEKGNLLIMSSKDVKENFSLYSEGSTVNLEAAHDTWKSEGVKNLNNVCAEYGKGTGAIGARSITVEDVNKVTGYDPETAGYGSGNIYVYKNQVTYYWDSDNLPAYKYTKADGTTATGNLANPHNKFVWPDEESQTVKTSTKTANAADDALEEITTITSTYYGYAGTAGANKLTTSNEAYKMLFRNADNTANVTYWLASPYVATYTYYVNFGMRIVNDGSVYRDYLFGSAGGTGTPARGVRAVVTLQSSAPMSSLTK